MASKVPEHQAARRRQTLNNGRRMLIALPSSEFSVAAPYSVLLNFIQKNLKKFGKFGSDCIYIFRLTRANQSRAHRHPKASPPPPRARKKPGDGEHGGRRGEARPPRGRRLRLPPQGFLQPRPPPRRGGGVRGVGPGDARGARRHLRAAAAQHRPRDARRGLPARRRGLPRPHPHRRLLPLRLARVQLLHRDPSEECT